MWHAGSDVMGCRRPTGGVFTYVSSDTSHAEAFPVATPRGRSSSSHEGELFFFVYVNHNFDEADEGMVGIRDSFQKPQTQTFNP